MIDVKIKLLEGGQLPVYKRDGDVCMDCFAAENTVVNIGTRKLVKLGFALELPEEWEAVIRPRSGNSKNGIDITIGTIDTNYRGEVMACVVNDSSNSLYIEKGDRICQLAVRPAPKVNFVVVDQLSETNRNEAGFGSSGK